MKIGDLHKDREAADYPSVEAMAEQEVALAKKSYPNAVNDFEALVFAARSLRKSLAERMAEVHQYRGECYKLRDELNTVDKAILQFLHRREGDLETRSQA